MYNGIIKEREYVVEMWTDTPKNVMLPITFQSLPNYEGGTNL